MVRFAKPARLAAVSSFPSSRLGTLPPTLRVVSQRPSLSPIKRARSAQNSHPHVHRGESLRKPNRGLRPALIPILTGRSRNPEDRGTEPAPSMRRGGRSRVGRCFSPSWLSPSFDGLHLASGWVRFCGVSDLTPESRSLQKNEAFPAEQRRGKGVGGLGGGNWGHWSRPPRFPVHGRTTKLVVLLGRLLSSSPALDHKDPLPETELGLVFQCSSRPRGSSFYCGFDAPSGDVVR